MVKKKKNSKKTSSRSRNKRIGSVKSKQAVRSVDVRRIQAALQRLEKAQHAAVSRGADLVALADMLGKTAVAKRHEGLVRLLRQKELLRDIPALKHAFDDVPVGGLPQQLEQLRLVPDAIIQWLADAFGLTPCEQTGQEMELPAHRLKNFIYDGDMPDDPQQLVRIRVIGSGWNLNGKPFIQSRVMLVGKLTS